MKILFGTNFSVQAEEATFAMAGLAARSAGKLTLAHVINPLLYRRPLGEFVAYLRDKRQAMLENLASQIRLVDDDVETFVAEGLPASRLVSLAGAIDADLVALSSPGPISLMRFCFGSIANAVIENTSVPVMLIRKADKFHPWLTGLRPLKVLIGYSFCAASDKALRWAADLRNVAPCDFTVSYAAVAENEAARLGIGPIMSPIYYPAGLKRLLEREVRQRSDSVLGQDSAQICVRANWSRPGSHLIEMADETQADLIVVGTSQRRGLARLRSVSGDVLRRARLNVACVPACFSGTRQPVRNFVSESHLRGSNHLAVVGAP